MLGFVRAAAADAPQMLGQHRRESRRHVLRDQHRRAIDRRGELFQQRGERLRTAGRGADHERARRGDGERPQGNFAASRRGAAWAQAHGCGRRLRRGRGVASGAKGGGAELARGRRLAGKAADLVDQFAAERRRGHRLVGGFRLGNVVGRPERQRPQAQFGAAPRQRRDHDHDEIASSCREAAAAPRCRQAPACRRRAARHRDRPSSIRSSASRPLRSAAAICHVRLGLDPARHHAARDDGVVDDHHPDLAARRRARSARLQGRNS